MEENSNLYIKTDDNKVINEKSILWIKKMNDCLEVCVRSDGCIPMKNTHKICKLNTPDSYNKLNNYFN